MRRYEYISYYVNNFAVRKSLETGKYQVVENIPDYKILVWETFGDSMEDYEKASEYARKLATTYCVGVVI
jgi:hypothetical protein